MDRSTARIRMTITLSLLAIILVLGGCMDASLSQSGSAPATLSIQQAPSAVTQFELRISGGGVEVSETLSSGTEAVVFELPVGQEHQLSIDAANFLGSRSFVLPPRGAQIDVQMLEKLLVVDQQSGRLIQIDDMSGTDWQELSGLSSPNDALVGPDGRIYVINNDGAIGNTVSVVETIGDTPTSFVPGDDTKTYYALASDPGRDLIWYAADATSGPLVLEARRPGGTVAYSVPELLSDFVSFWGLAVSGEGIVYVSGLAAALVDVEGELITFNRPLVRRFDPENAGSVVDRIIGTDVASDSDPHVDVLSKDGALFVTNPSGGSNRKIVRLDPVTLAVEGGFGSYPAVEAEPGPGELYGPRRFVASSNGPITVIDESSTFTYDRIVQFGPNGGSWKTYDGSDQGGFGFFIGF